MKEKIISNIDPKDFVKQQIDSAFNLLLIIEKHILKVTVHF